MKLSIKQLTIDQYDQILALWQASDGVGLSEADSRENIAGFLKRNPGFSFVAFDGEQLAGVVLCGHDGRRGYIHHLAVNHSHRRQGIGRALVAHCLAALERAGIGKCHIFVFRENEAALAFWQGTGWIDRVDLTILSQYTKA